MRTSLSSCGAASGPEAKPKGPLDIHPKGGLLINSNTVRYTKDDVAQKIVVIERWSFVRSCILSSLAKVTDLVGVGVASVDECLACSAEFKVQIVILSARGARTHDVAAQIVRLKTSLGCSTPIAVMSDSEDIDLLTAVMESGADGLIPGDISLEVVAQVIRLIIAGGQYFPVNTLLAAREKRDDKESGNVGLLTRFTRRQIDVIDALRKGKANKIIAYELNMRESTVKVHVRNIMKKLRAKNRTEVAYLASELLDDQHISD